MLRYFPEQRNLSKVKMGLFVFCMVANSFGIYQQAMINPGTVTNIDGWLTETEYSDSNKICDLDPSYNTVFTEGGGSLSGSSDLSASVYTFWDATYLYIGVAFTDDIHFANRQGMFDSWKDDNVQIWVSRDYNDATTDPWSPYYGTYGYQFIISLDLLL